ncbi:MAG: carboxypeptidase regulatory-like domain-containing protein [Gemmatimonadaceae bacterium]|nr:carboxypeptidase regulatory-like domain-containing protein [Gemmatimonadaceae bacterium]
MVSGNGWKRGAMVGVLVALLPRAAQGQVVRGTVVDATARVVSGAVVALVDSTQTVVARALTDDRGEYRVVAPRAGSYRLRTLRIGFQPTVSSTLVLREGTVSVERLVLEGVRVTLDAVRIVSQSACGRQASTDADATFAAWDQAMTSIAATNLTSAARGLTATVMQIDRTLEPDGRKIRAQSATVRTDFVTQPWKSLPADTLRRRGYMTTDADDWTTYSAPGLDVLVSPHFLEDHCLRLVKARDSTEIGVAFEPTPERFRRSEIRGTLWLDRTSADLRRLDFTFTTLPGALKDFPAGGAMAFERLTTGAIVISSWEIRMPRLVKESPRSVKVRVADIGATGGQLVVLRRNADTLFRRATLSVSGVVLDSTSGNPQARASVALVGTATQALTDAAGRFVLNDVLPGEYALAVRTPSLDSIRASSQSTILVAEGMTAVRLKVPTATQLAASLCGTTLSGAAGRGKGAVLGTLRDAGDTTMLGGIRVVADWTEIDTRGGALQRQAKRMETQSDGSGAFRICGVPTETVLTVRAMPARGRSQTVTVRLTPDERFASTSLPVDRGRPAVATFSGVVVADSSQRPLADAEVSIPALSLSTRSNARGEFRLNDVPAGTHEIFARRVGYGAMTAQVTFAANDEEERRLVLRPLTVLDSVEVLATRADRALLEFEENRKLGLGHFITREELDKHRNQKMGDLLSMVPGTGVARGRTSGAWILSKRFVVPLSAASGQGSGSIYSPDATERMLGIVAGCYAQVWLDNRLMNAGQPTEPFDVNSIAPDQIEGVEWYAGAAQTPSRYSKLGSNCGVLVIHRRRFDPR